MFSKIGTTELLVILAIALLIFGPKNLPKLGKMLGETLSGFRKGHKAGIEEGEEDAAGESAKR